MSEEILTPQTETRFGRPSGTRKTLLSVLGGLGLFVGVSAFGAYADGKANEQEYARTAEVQKANQFDITRAKVVQLVNLDEQDQPEETK
jgi:hypothetical protein